MVGVEATDLQRRRRHRRACSRSSSFGLITLLPPSCEHAVGLAADRRHTRLAANVCYTFGWAIEATAQRIWGRRCPAFGPALFRQGLAFAVGLTLLPILIVSVGWVARVAGLILR